MKALLTIACVVVALIVAPAAQSGLDPALVNRLDAFVAEEFAKDGVGGTTVAVVKGGSLAWAKGYGLADIEARTPATANTVYRIGSITKPFTAVMMLQLVERGTVRLSDPVEKYLPEINRITDRPKDAPAVTFEQLATMMSGIAREPDDLNTFLVGPVERWEHVLFEALPKTKYDHAPGTRYLYSNIGYAILGASLGRAAKQPYVEYMRESVIRPLGMTTTDFVPSAAIRPGLAKGYEIREGKPNGEQPAKEHDGRGYKVPNGALYTTVGDLAKFVSLWLGDGPESVLKKTTIADTFARLPADANYGIGFQVVRRDGKVYYSHGGSVAGYRAQMSYDTRANVGVIVLRNVGGGTFSPGPVAARLLAMVTENPSPVF